MSCLNWPRMSLVESTILAVRSINFPPIEVSDGASKTSGMASILAGMMSAWSVTPAGIDVDIERLPLFRLEAEPISFALFGDDSVQGQRRQDVGGGRMLFVLVGRDFQNVCEGRDTNPVRGRAAHSGLLGVSAEFVLA